MKTAKWSIAAVYVQCPHCDESVVSAKGSLMLTGEQVIGGLTPGTKLQCSACSEWFKLPAILGRLS